MEENRLTRSQVGCLAGSLLFLLAAATSVQGASRALLVGVGIYENHDIPVLKAIPNDLRLIRGVLETKYGFEGRIQVLRDEQATKERVLATFKEWLIQGTAPGDVAVFYFSGHGAQIPDGNEDEKDDKLDEVLCLYDFGKKGETDSSVGAFVDDELQGLVKQLEGRTIFLIIDSCYSGTIQRSFLPTKGLSRSVFVPAGEVGGSLPHKGSPGFPSLDQTDLDLDDLLDDEGDGGLEARQDNLIVLAAAQSNEQAAQVFLPGGNQVVSAFTYGLVKGLDGGAADGVGGPKDGRVSYEELWEYTRVVLNKLGKRQTPFVDPPLESTSLQKSVFAFVGPPSPPGQSAELTAPRIAMEPLVVTVTGAPSCGAKTEAGLQGFLKKTGFVQVATLGQRHQAKLHAECGVADSKELKVRLIEEADVLHPVRSLSMQGELLEMAMAEGLSADLETAYVGVNLRRLQQNQKVPALEFWVEGPKGKLKEPVFKFGDLPKLKMRSQKAGFLYLFVTNSQGQMALLFPNRWRKSPRIEANTVFMIPEIEVTPPEGSDLLKAVLFYDAPVQFPGLPLDKLDREDFLVLDPQGGMGKNLARTVVETLYAACQPGKTNWNAATLQTWAVAK